MTYIPEISQGFTATDQAKKTSADTKAQTTSSKEQTLGQDDFLQLLVAQLQNQDPLDPTDTTEFTAQLTSYSQLEQLFNLNDSMDQLTESRNDADRFSSLSMIGKEVRVAGSSFELGEDTAEIGYSIDGSASEIQIHIQDSTGKRVTTLYPSDLTAGDHSITWQGMDDNGEHLPPGEYSLLIESKGTGSGESVGVTPLVLTNVNGVDLGGTDPLLITDAGEFSISDIRGVYQSDSSDEGLKNDSQTTDTENSEANVSGTTDASGIVDEAASIVQTVQDAEDTISGE